MAAREEPSDPAMAAFDVFGAVVPCRGCTACCQHPVPVAPELGDDPTAYELEPEPLDGRAVLRQKPGGGCVYAGATGCMIYNRRPAMCRAFDCRRLWTVATAEQRRSLVRSDRGWQRMIDAGRARTRRGT